MSVSIQVKSIGRSYFPITPYASIPVPVSPRSVIRSNVAILYMIAQTEFLPSFRKMP